MTLTQHAQTPSPLPGEIRDGLPHVTYYRAPLSFVWTGHQADPIHVQEGGYGEPTIALIPATVTDQTTPAEALARFREQADQWWTEWHMGEHPFPYARDIVAALCDLGAHGASIEGTGGGGEAIRIPADGVYALISNADASLPQYDDETGGVAIGVCDTATDALVAHRWLPGPPAADVTALVAWHLLSCRRS